jgi:hypothetical protein
MPSIFVMRRDSVSRRSSRKSPAILRCCLTLSRTDGVRSQAGGILSRVRCLFLVVISCYNGPLLKGDPMVVPPPSRIPRARNWITQREVLLDSQPFFFGHSRAMMCRGLVRDVQRRMTKDSSPEMSAKKFMSCQPIRASQTGEKHSSIGDMFYGNYPNERLAMCTRIHLSRQRTDEHHVFRIGPFIPDLLYSF